MNHCTPLDVWYRNDFTSCFHQSVLNGLVPLLVITWSLSKAIAMFMEFRVNFALSSKSHKNVPLLRNTRGQTYGALSTPAGRQQQDQQHAGGSSFVVESDSFATGRRLTRFDVTRLLGIAIVLGLDFFGFYIMVFGQYNLEEDVERSYDHVKLSLGVHGLAASYLLFLSVAAVFVSNIHLSYGLRRQVNLVLLYEVLARCVDIRSFYITNCIDVIQFPGYARVVEIALVELLMLAVLIHENRYSPVSPKLGVSSSRHTCP
ncbi:hypothetical protein BX666DRAFT_173087 [Dichotomocladium elegans]|nr:hypothetical protein BX666DRAFT_173087 [Dichotomocladium elegans]